MLKELIQKGIFPSPLILETRHQEEWMRQIALYALCDSESACGLCPQCKQVSRGHHPDWLYLSGDSSSDELRALLGQLRRKPFQAKRRLLSLTKMAEANPFFQNQLLKTLEEPHVSWVILLGAQSIYSLLDTIRSRCLIFRDRDPNSKAAALSESEEAIFRSLEEKKELSVFQEMEKIFKDRKKAKVTLSKFLEKASDEMYPGYWRQLAPALEMELAALDRNLHPKTVWAKVTARASYDR